MDDMRIGLRSLAIYLGDKTTNVCLASSVLFVALSSYGGFLNGQHLSFFLAIGLAGTKLVMSVIETDINSPSECKRMFMETPSIGLIILFGLFVDGVYYRFSHHIPI